MIDFIEDYPTTISRDLQQFILGRRIGKGINREVFEFPHNKDYVIKVETEGFQNIREWELWNEIKDTKLAKWFAPCIKISNCGIYLLQRKTEKIPESEYPQKTPHFFNDQKYDNFGVIIEKGKRRFVCHDYGTFSLTNGYKDKLLKAKWWK